MFAAEKLELCGKASFGLFLKSRRICEGGGVSLFFDSSTTQVSTFSTGDLTDALEASGSFP